MPGSLSPVYHYCALEMSVPKYLTESSVRVPSSVIPDRTWSMASRRAAVSSPLAHGNGNLGCLRVQAGDLHIGLRVLSHVVVEAHLRIEGGVDASAGQQLDGLDEVVHAVDHDVIPPGFQPGRQAVELALHEDGRYPQLPLPPPAGPRSAPWRTADR